MVKAKTKNQLTTVLLIAAAIVVAGLVLNFMSAPGTPTASMLTPSQPIETGTTGQPAQIQVVSDPRTYTDLSGTLSMSIQNSLNTTNKQYMIETIRIYKANDLNTLYGTLATINTGTGRGTLAIDKYDAEGNPQNYVAFIPSNYTGAVSAQISFQGAENVIVDAKIPKQSRLAFKVYDLENRAYLWDGLESTPSGLETPGTLNVSGTTWFSTTSNSTGYAVGVGGFYNYQVYLTPNNTIAAWDTVSQWQDQEFIMAMDAGDLSDWQKPSISVAGATVTELMPGQYNDKIKNDGYDWVWKITGADGKALNVCCGTFTKIEILQYGKAGVNPSDDITLGFYTSGYYTHTLDDAMGMSTHQDDSSQTAVYTPQTLVLSIS